MLASMTPDDVISLIRESQLAGRGGAGFPTGVKWRAVAEAPGTPKTVVCNADEGEPGCFKDRVLMDLDPHAVIEGMLLAGYATGEWNSAHYDSPEFNAAVKAYQATVDLESRKEAIKPVQQIAHDDIPYVIPYFYNVLSAHKTNVTGIVTTGLGHYYVGTAGFTE